MTALLNALPADRIRLGHEFVAFERSGSKVRVHFANGSTVEHDALIGADGFRSRVRSQLFGVSDPVYRGYFVWRGLARYAGNDIPQNNESWGAGKRFGILNTGHERFTWYAAVNLPRDHRDAGCGRKQELMEMFEGWHKPVEACIASTPEESISQASRARSGSAQALGTRTRDAARRSGAPPYAESRAGRLHGA